jgi:hypothetical protein
MATVKVEDSTAAELELLARAWQTTPGQVVERLLNEFRTGGASATPPASAGHATSVPVHVSYRGVRVEAVYDPLSSALTITKGPEAGRRFRTPSAAAIAVVSALNPKVNPNRNGWSFWIVTATGKRLQAIRDKSR